jgi:hypothetical protein
MKIRSACHMAAVVVLAASTSSSAKSPDQAYSWSVLGKITHKRHYAIETRDRKCTWGTITAVSPDHLSAKVYDPNSHASGTVTFSRADILRVAVGRWVYYSGRSSWSDVGSVRLEGRERLKIVTMVGETYEAKQPYTVSDDGITLQISGKSMKIAKSEIKQVYGIAIKPLTDTGEYLQEELGPMIIFDPDLYVYGLHLEQYVPVLLYDVSNPEDNSPAQCAPR